MKTINKIRKVKQVKTDEQCQIHSNIAAFALGLNRQQDAARIRKDKRRSVPLAMLDMVF